MPLPNWPDMPLVRGLSSGSYPIEDNKYLSKYFKVRGIEDSYGIGTYIFSIHGSDLLVPGSDILYEFIDSAGNLIPSNIEREKEQLPSFIFSFNINRNVTDGMGIFTVVGSSRENNKGRKLNNLLKDVRWQVEVRINKSKDIDFSDIVAVDNLQVASSSTSDFTWLYSGSMGTSSENGVLLAWESMYGHVGQSSSHADGTVKYVSELKWKQIENYYVYMFIPYGTLYWPPENPYPGSGSVSGNWILHGITNAPPISSSESQIPTRSVYYFAGALPNNKHVTFWVGGSTNTTYRMKSKKSIQRIPMGIATPITMEQYYKTTSGNIPSPD